MNILVDLFFGTLIGIFIVIFMLFGTLFLYGTLFFLIKKLITFVIFINQKFRK